MNKMPEFDAGNIILGLIILDIISIITIICLFISKRRKIVKIVQETSILLKKLSELNSEYKFGWNVQKQYTFRILLQSKPKFDRYELMDLLDENILNNSELMQAAKVIENNRNLYVVYHKKVEQLQSEITQEQAKTLHISYITYTKIEKELFAEQQIKPILDSDIICIASYSSPGGRNHYSKTSNYKIDEVPKRYEMLQQKIVNQNSEEMKRKRARSQMTPKLRYSILKRDGFRCTICGRTAEDGVKLHVDHIIPVSKGGETIPSNLRTLCETCNLGKSDEIE